MKHKSNDVVKSSAVSLFCVHYFHRLCSLTKIKKSPLETSCHSYYCLTECLEHTNQKELKKCAIGFLCFLIWIYWCKESNSNYNFQVNDMWLMHFTDRCVVATWLQQILENKSLYQTHGFHFQSHCWTSVYNNLQTSSVGTKTKTMTTTKMTRVLHYLINKRVSDPSLVYTKLAGFTNHLIHEYIPIP